MRKPQKNHPAREIQQLDRAGEEKAEAREGDGG
jgi:hypothetical protein